MNLETISDVWEALKTHIYLQEQEAAADTLVNLLVDSGYALPDIKEAFDGDREILNALKQFFDDVEQDFDDQLIDDEEDDDWN